MAKTEKEEAKGAWATLSKFFSSESVEMSEDKPTEKKEVKLASELAEGEYTLEDGTKFRIDEAGNVVDVVAPDAEEAEEEETARREQDTMMSEENEQLKTKVAELEAKLSTSKTELEEKDAKITELSEVKAISDAPKPKEEVKLKQYGSRRSETTMDRVMRRVSQAK